MNSLKQRMFDWGGLWLSLAAVLFVLGWRGVVWANRPAHFLDIARELGSIGQFKDGLFPNKAGTRIVYMEDVELGEGLFFCTIPGGRAKLLCEPKALEIDWGHFGMLGWSPDDSRFAYAVPSRKGEIFICVCDGDSGDVISKVEAPGKLSELAWLTDDSFAYLVANYNYQLRVVEHKPDGRWVETRNFTRLYRGRGTARNLVAISSNSVAWSDKTNLWALDVNAKIPQMIWQGTNSQLLGFTYSREKEEFLLNCADETNQFLIRCDPWRKWMVNAGAIGDLQHPVANVSWVNGGASYVYRLKDGGTNTFFIKSDVKSPPKRLPWPGGMRTFAMSGGHLYVAGSVGADPAGIYDYDPKADTLSLVVSSLKSPLKYAKCVTPSNGAFTNEQGRVVTYALWRPLNAAPQKKYPLILSQTPYIWMPFPQIAANQGYYFVMIDRPSWASGQENWSDDVMNAYQRLIQDPNVDTNSVFLYGASAETSYISQLLVEKPDLWKGAITLSSSSLPDLPATTHMSSALVIVGEDDKGAAQRWTKYQDDEARNGIRVNLVIQDDTAHISRSIATELERAEGLARYLNENR